MERYALRRETLEKSYELLRYLGFNDMWKKFCRAVKFKGKKCVTMNFPQKIYLV